MIRYLFAFCLTLSLLGCGMFLGLDEFSDADSGTTGNGGTAGTGGNTGGGGQGGQSGSGGDGGQGGQGGDPCMTGIYLTVDSYGSGGTLSSGSGPVTIATFDVHGTSPGNELTDTVSIVNNLVGDFTDPQNSTALTAVRVRCQDPGGASSYTTVCTAPLVGGETGCPNPGCHSASSGIVKMQIQIDPAPGGSGQVRLGIKPNSINICDDQSGSPIYTIIP